MEDRMGNSALTGLLLFVVGGLVAGCAQHSALSKTEADQQLQVLVARADVLRAKLGVESGSGAALRPEFDSLVADARSWRARTGRSDIRVGTESVKGPATVAAAPGGGGVGDDGCRPCPGFQVWPDHICFLVEEGPCHAEDEGIILRVCAYECIWIGSGPQPGGVKTAPY
jgi:hypothetical protein